MRHVTVYLTVIRDPWLWLNKIETYRIVSKKWNNTVYMSGLLFYTSEILGKYVKKTALVFWNHNENTNYGQGLDLRNGHGLPSLRIRE